jgi:putative homeodomain leucine zipper protein HDZ3
MLESILTLLSTLVGGGVLGMLFERKKRKVETDAIEAEVVDRIQIIYKKFLEDYNQKITDLLNENEKLKEKIRKLEERINELSK